MLYPHKQNCAYKSCNKEFLSTRAGHIYCSPKCCGRAGYKPREPKIIRCALERCQKSFVRKQNNQRFCCREHQREFNKLSKMKMKEKVSRVCAYEKCSKEFKTWSPTRKYCSRNCWQKNKYHERRKYKTRLCVICGKPVKPPKYKYCSKHSFEDIPRGKRKVDYDPARPTTAKCPLCERLHKVSINWTGRGMPRIYCESCKYLDVVRYGQLEERFGCGRV